MTLMHPHMIKLLSLSGLTLGLLAASQGVRADEVQAPTFTAEPASLDQLAVLHCNWAARMSSF